MATWTISPTTGGASINSSGQATFPENSGTTNQVYTITYTNNGCSTSTTYTVLTCATRTITINYTVSFDNLEKGSVTTKLNYPGGSRNITATSAGWTSQSGTTSGTISIQSHLPIEIFADSMEWDLYNSEAEVVHNTITFTLTYTDALNKFIKNLTQSECDLWSQGLPAALICDGVNCRLCASYTQRIATNGNNSITAEIKIGYREL